VAEWLFVGGAGRTGTTLLAWCLAQHPDILMSAYESALPLQLIRLLDPGSPDADPVRWHDEAGTEWLQTGHQFRWSYGPSVLDARDCAAAMLRGLAESQTGYRYIADKYPAYAQTWPALRALCPGCRIIFITRGRKATVDSWMRLGWVETRAQAEKMIYWREACAWTCPDAIWVRLEDLNRDHYGVMTDLFQRLDLDPGRANWELIKYQVWGLRGPLN
jgi:hypothetical protein